MLLSCCVNRIWIWNHVRTLASHEAWKIMQCLYVHELWVLYKEWMQCNVMSKKCELWTFYKEQNGVWHLQYVWTLRPLWGVECCATFEALRYKLWIHHLFCCTKYFKTKLQVEIMILLNKLSHGNWKETFDNIKDNQMYIFWRFFSWHHLLNYHFTIES